MTAAATKSAKYLYSPLHTLLYITPIAIPIPIPSEWIQSYNPLVSWGAAKRQQEDDKDEEGIAKHRKSFAAFMAGALSLLLDLFFFFFSPSDRSLLLLSVLFEPFAPVLQSTRETWPCLDWFYRRADRNSNTIIYILFVCFKCEIDYSEVDRGVPSLFSSNRQCILLICSNFTPTFSISMQRQLATFTDLIVKLSFF